MLMSSAHCFRNSDILGLFYGPGHCSVLMQSDSAVLVELS